MNGLHKRKPVLSRMSACCLALLMPLAGLSFGGGQNASNPACCPDGVCPGVSEDSGPDGSGQIEKGSVIAVKIEKRKKVLVLTPLGQEVIYSPAIRADGVKGDDRSGRSILFPWSDIRAVKIRRSGVGFGALIGFMAGAGLGYWGVTAIIDDPAGPAGSDYFRAMSILGGLGAIGGGLIGAVASGWKTVYTSPRGPRPVPRISLARTRRGGMAVSLSLAF